MKIDIVRQTPPPPPPPSITSVTLIFTAKEWHDFGVIVDRYDRSKPTRVRLPGETTAETYDIYGLLDSLREALGWEKSRL